MRADGLDLRRLARGTHPAWAPDGDRIAFDRDGEIRSVAWSGGGARIVAARTEPAYSASGVLAYVDVGGEVVAGAHTIGPGLDPAWSPTGRQVAYDDGTSLYVDGELVGKGVQPAWRPAPPVRPLPDLVQRPPAHLTAAGGPGTWQLRFTSMVDNVGLGPLMVVGERSPGQPLMTATQHVRLSNGARRTYPGVGRLRYTNSPPHHHWHLMRYDVFQLRTLQGQVLMSDRKSGFCLADHWGAAPGNWPGRRPMFLGDCEQYHPEATHVVEGTSLGYTDRYPAFFHGQNVSLARVPSGVYDLVHRVNSNLYLHELRYENDAASVRLRLMWAHGRPSVAVLRSCAETVTC